jgi:hypothetical protein
MITSTRPCACYTGHIGATGRAEVRAISGFPSHSLWRLFNLKVLTSGKHKPAGFLFSKTIIKEIFPLVKKSPGY